MKKKTAMMQLINHLESQISMVDNNSDHEDIAYADGMNYAKEIAIKLIEKEKEEIRLARLQGENPALNSKVLIDIANDYYNETYKQD